MADEEKEEQSGGEEEKKKSPLMLIIIGVVVLLLLIVGGVLMMLLSGDESEGEMEPSAKKETRKKANDLTVGPIFPMDQFIVNLLGGGGRRYLKTELSLEMDSEDLMPELESKTPVLRDVIIKTLSSKTFDEIATEGGKDRLKEELKAHINNRLVDGQVANVYFTVFVVQ